MESTDSLWKASRLKPELQKDEDIFALSVDGMEITEADSFKYLWISKDEKA